MMSDILIRPEVRAASEEAYALARQQKAIMRTGFDSIEDVKRNVIAAYSGGASKLTQEQMEAMIAIAWNMNLDPSPGAGHIYAATFGGKFTILIGYQGYLHRAQRDHKLYYNPARAMTQEERRAHGLSEKQVGAVCELYEMERAKIAREIGIPVQPILGIGIWTPGDNIAKTKSPLWMAGKNAIKDAIRQLGLGFGATAIPQIHGFEYDNETETFTQITNPNPIPAPIEAAPAEDVVEAEIMSSLKTTRQTDLEIPDDASQSNSKGATSSATPPAPKDDPKEALKSTKRDFLYPQALQSDLQQRASQIVLEHPETAVLIDWDKFDTLLKGKLKDFGRYDFLKAMFQKPTSKELSRAEGKAVMDWFASDPELAAREFTGWMDAYHADLPDCPKPLANVSTLPRTASDDLSKEDNNDLEDWFGKGAQDVPAA